MGSSQPDEPVHSNSAAPAYRVVAGDASASSRFRQRSILCDEWLDESAARSCCRIAVSEFAPALENARFGSGWISGMVSAVLGIMSFGAVLCLRFPALLTS